MKNIKTISIVSIAILMIFSMCIIGANKGINNTETVNGEAISNKKIGWGIKRNDNNEQPDVGAANKKILEEKNRYMFRKRRRQIYIFNI